MALSFAKIEAVNFGGLKVEPVITTERRLRAQDIKMNTEAGRAEAARVLSEFFEGHETEVEAFIKKNMGANDIGELAAYLVGGPQAALKIDNAIADNLKDLLKKGRDSEEV